MRVRHTATALTTAALLALTACSSADTKDSSSGNSSAAARQLDTAPNIAAALNDAGLTASTPQEQTEASYITKVGGTAYALTITDKVG
ncbi:hypothetical protein ACWD26_01675 [Streptomyces sp. NPDC002787]